MGVYFGHISEEMDVDFEKVSFVLTICTPNLPKIKGKSRRRVTKRQIFRLRRQWAKKQVLKTIDNGPEGQIRRRQAAKKFSRQKMGVYQKAIKKHSLQLLTFIRYQVFLQQLLKR